MPSSRQQQAGLLLAVSVVLFVPHHLHNRRLAHIDGETVLAEATAETLSDAAVQDEREVQKIKAQIADLQKELGTVRETRVNNAAKLAEVQQGDCGVPAIEQTHRAKSQAEYLRLKAEAAPRLHQLELETEGVRQAAQEEESEMEISLPILQAQEEELQKEKLGRQAEVALGKALRDNDSAFVRQWVQRVTTMDLFMGPFMMNQVNAPILEHSVAIPLWNGGTESIGKAHQELLDILPKMDPFLKPKPVLYKRCAVVSTSGLLLYYKSGAEIDSHDAVIRFNAATTRGFEEFAGSKTTVRFTDRANFGYSEKVNEIVLQLVTNSHTLEKFVGHRRENPNSKVFMVAPEFHMHVVGDLIGAASPSFYGVLFALQRCQEVSLYGFARGTGISAPYNYYNAEEPGEAELQREAQEFHLVQELIRRSSDRAHVSEPCVSEEDCQNEHGCLRCAVGSRCECGNIMPVAKPGFCMESGVADCFYSCLDANNCPGGSGHTLCGDELHVEECASK